MDRVVPEVAPGKTVSIDEVIDNLKGEALKKPAILENLRVETLSSIADKLARLAVFDKLWVDKVIPNSEKFGKAYKWGQENPMKAAFLCAAAGQAVGTFAWVADMRNASPDKYIQVGGRINKEITIEVGAGKLGPWMVHVHVAGGYG